MIKCSSVMIVLCAVLFSSCKERDSIKKKISLLTGDSTVYWDLVFAKDKYDKTKEKIFPLFCYSFSRDGKYYIYRYQKNKRIRKSGSDLVLLQTWEVTKDSQIKIDEELVKIIVLTQDTLKYQKDGDIYIFSKSKVQSSAMDSITYENMLQP